MSKIAAIAIFDIGKTNKKLLLFDEGYQLVYEESAQLPETKDEDGFDCEDIMLLTDWVTKSFHKILQDDRFIIKAVNVAAYGASFVYLDEERKVMLPLYSYLKPYPDKLLKKFYADYGDEKLIGKQTASPSLGNLNSGLQLYRLKYERPEAFSKIKFALHLPQYISYILSSKIHSEITSIGCHTYLWNFDEGNYHTWVNEERIGEKLPGIKGCDDIGYLRAGNIPVGVGLHDSSAALIPYLAAFNEPFVLISTGTWCISLNPFNHALLTDYELENDCLCYLNYLGKPVKASRLFAGHEHDQHVKRLATHFDTDVDRYKTVIYKSSLLKKMQNDLSVLGRNTIKAGQPSGFEKRDLSEFQNYEEAYHELIFDLISQQVKSTNFVLNDTPVKKIIVDGGFANNIVYMNLLAVAFAGLKVYAANLAQATALGAAIVIHKHWNKNVLPGDPLQVIAYEVK
jgi:sugar (pentulose or hexulose) kinase